MAAQATSLLARLNIDDHAEALSLADAALTSLKAGSPDQLTAQHTKVVALLRLERYDDALRVIAGGGDALASRCLLEHGYALYKTGALEEAFSLLTGSKQEQQTSQDPARERMRRHIAAQVAYRLEKFDQATALYVALLDGDEEDHEDEETDLRINLLAAQAQLEWQGRGDLVPEKRKQPGREDLEAFETAYNAGCGCVARGDLSKALVLLKRAADLCDATDSLTEDDKKIEMLPIVLQQAYVLARLGKKEEAAALQKGVEDYEISDESIDGARKWNSLISKSLTNPFLVERLAELVPKANVGKDRFFKHQAVGAARNKAAVDLSCYKYNGLSKNTSSLLKQDTTPSTDLERLNLGYLNAAAKAKCESNKQALEKVVEVLEKRPYDIGLLLTIIQLYVQAKKYDSAIGVLHRFFRYIEEAGTSDHADVRYAPGLVALAVALYRTQNRQKEIRKELGRAAAHWQSIQNNSSTTLLREAGIELLRSSKPSDLATAGAAFERLAEQNPDDKISHAGIVASFATSDFAKVESHLPSLSSVEELTAGVDVSALLDAGVPAFPVPPQPSPAKKKRKAVDDADVADATGAAKPTTAPATKPKKKIRRLGKNYDPNAKVDPERWLPMRDRSYYRPKNKKGKKKAADSVQGGIVANETETLHLAGGAGQIKVEKAPGGGGGKKKKGRKN